MTFRFSMRKPLNTKNLLKLSIKKPYASILGSQKKLFRRQKEGLNKSHFVICDIQFHAVVIHFIVYFLSQWLIQLSKHSSLQSIHPLALSSHTGSHCNKQSLSIMSGLFLDSLNTAKKQEARPKRPENRMTSKTRSKTKPPCALITTAPKRNSRSMHTEDISGISIDTSLEHLNYEQEDQRWYHGGVDRNLKLTYLAIFLLVVFNGFVFSSVAAKWTTKNTNSNNPQSINLRRNSRRLVKTTTATQPYESTSRDDESILDVFLSLKREKNKASSSNIRTKLAAPQL